jgi:hypothetical protein
MWEAQGAVDESHAILGAEAEIGDHQIDGIILEHTEGAGDIAGDIDVKAVLESGAKAVASVLFVINDQ